mgnify:CR=1 FL=1
MAYSFSPPCDGVCIMLLIIVMEATVYSLEPLLQSSSSPRGGARVTRPLFLNHDTA